MMEQSANIQYVYHNVVVIKSEGYKANMHDYTDSLYKPTMCDYAPTHLHPTQHQMATPPTSVPLPQAGQSPCSGVHLLYSVGMAY